MADMLKQADEMQKTIDTHGEDARHHRGRWPPPRTTWSARCTNMTVDITELRDHIADFDDFFRPLRNYFYWEPHCFDIPVCWSMRSIFDTLDGIDTMTDDIQDLLPDMERLDALMPQMVALMPAMIATMKTMKNMHADHVSGPEGHAGSDATAMQDNSTAMGQAFDAVQERRLLLPAAGGLREPRLQARHEDVPVPGRTRGAVHHQP